MNRTKNIARILAFLLLIGGVAVLLGFVGHTRTDAAIQRIEIKGFDDLELQFISAERVENLIMDASPDILGTPVIALDTRELEAEITAIPHVKSAKVFKTMNRALVVEIEEYDPFIRVIDRVGRSAWIDRNGVILPVSKHKALRLPVVSGDFLLDSKWLTSRVSVHADTLRDHVLQSVYAYGKVVDADPFWKAQLQYSEVNAHGDFTATPQVGQHTIVFGSVADLPAKLRKLAIFYDKALGSDNWNAYAQINLKFKDQIVCTKK